MYVHIMTHLPCTRFLLLHIIRSYSKFISILEGVEIKIAFQIKNLMENNPNK